MNFANLVAGVDGVGVLERKAVYMRLQQLAINELYLQGIFRVPIHLALGHEPVAIGVSEASQDGDEILLSHRNIHYQLALGAPLESLIKEFLLLPDGLGKSRFGSMNLVRPDAGLTYTSSILGNNLPVAAGVAFSKTLKSDPGCTWVVTGDGALEEGAFAETLLLSKSIGTSLIIVVEDNGWSLATSVSERRCDINLQMLVEAYGGTFLEVGDCTIQSHVKTLEEARKICSAGNPVVVLVSVATLGGRWIDDASAPSGRRYINYHAGPVSGHSLDTDMPLGPLDPLSAISGSPWLVGFMQDVRARIREELAWTASLK